ncbi:Uma2 family endonuclease [Nostoc sp. DSM 114160]
MSQSIDERIRWTSADLELLPDNGNRYEIIDGELFVTRAPHWGHQKAIANICGELRTWSLSTGLGEAVPQHQELFLVMQITLFPMWFG